MQGIDWLINIIMQPDVAFPLQQTELQSCPTPKASLSLMHTLLHDEIDCFCKQVLELNFVIIIVPTFFFSSTSLHLILFHLKVCGFDPYH